MPHQPRYPAPRLQGCRHLFFLAGAIVSYVYLHMSDRLIWIWISLYPILATWSLVASSKVPELFTSVPPTWVGNPSKPPGCSDGQRSTRRVRPKKPTGQGVSLTPSSGNVDLNQQQIRCSDVFQRFLGMSFQSSLYDPVGYVCQLFVILVPKKGSQIQQLTVCDLQAEVDILDPLFDRWGSPAKDDIAFFTGTCNIHTISIHFPTIFVKNPFLGKRYVSCMRAAEELFGPGKIQR